MHTAVDFSIWRYLWCSFTCGVFHHVTVHRQTLERKRLKFVIKIIPKKRQISFFLGNRCTVILLHQRFGDSGLRSETMIAYRSKPCETFKLRLCFFFGDFVTSSKISTLKGKFSELALVSGSRFSQLEGQGSLLKFGGKNFPKNFRLHRFFFEKHFKPTRCTYAKLSFWANCPSLVPPLYTKACIQKTAR